MDIRFAEKLSLNHTLSAPILEKVQYPHDSLIYLKKFIIHIGATLQSEEFYTPSEGIWISKKAIVSPSAFIGSPCIIGHNTEIRHCAFIRGSALIGDDCVIGNSTEVKNSIIFDSVQIPHYNYVGDSILGYKSHLGAGAITSNVKGDRSTVTIDYGFIKIPTDTKKLGAILYDQVEVGCNTVLNPGTVIGKSSRIYPLTLVRGYIPDNSILKQNGETVNII